MKKNFFELLDEYDEIIIKAASENLGAINLELHKTNNLFVRYDLILIFKTKEYKFYLTCKEMNFLSPFLETLKDENIDIAEEEPSSLIVYLKNEEFIYLYTVCFMLYYLVYFY